MRYQADHKEKTRKQIVAAAGELFRRDGVVATGVVGLMKGAGLTQGGFYAHFESKEALVREAMVAALLETGQGIARIVPPDASPREALTVIFDAYLSLRHLRHPERGCAFAAAGGELARESPATRDALMAATRPFAELIERYLPPGRPDPQGLARTIFGLLLGTVQLARLTTDPAEAAAILDNGKAAALQLCA